MVNQFNTPNNTPSKRRKLHSTPQPSSEEDRENLHPKKLSYSRSTPTASDFFSSSRTPSTSKPTENFPMAKKSSANERVSELLGKLNQRLSSPGTSMEKQPLPQRELVQQHIVPDKPVLSLTESEPVLGWEDPVESAERAKVENCSPSSVDRPRRFALSNLAEREEYEEKLRQLGETVISTAHYEAEITHLIADHLQRSEKLLCCIAAGKWILHTSYIDLLVQNKRYLPEEVKYQWGNPANAEIPKLIPGSLSEQLAEAAVRWKKHLAKQRGGPFSDMKAFVYVTNRNKLDSYRRLIEAGGGQIATNTSDATHCFVEETMINAMPVSLSQLVSHKVPCLPPIFLNALLVQFPPPSTDEYLIAEYKRLVINQH